MSAEILEFDGYTTLSLSPQKILENISKNQEITHALVLTFHGDKFVAYSSFCDAHLANYMCDKLKYNIMTNNYEE